MDNTNTKDIFDPDSNNSQNNINLEFDPSIGPEVPETDTRDLPDDLNIKNDEDLFGEPLEEEQEQERGQEEEQEQARLPQSSGGELKKEGEELPQQDQVLKAEELPTADINSRDEARIKDDENNIEEENKALDFNANEQNFKAENEKIGGDEENVNNSVEVDMKRNGDEGKHNDNENLEKSDLSNDGNDLSTAKPDVTSDNTNSNINNQVNDNEINENKKEDEETPLIESVEKNQDKGFRDFSTGKQPQQQQQQQHGAMEQEPQPAAETGTTISTNAEKEQETVTKKTTRVATTENNDLALPQSHEIVIPSYAKWFNLTKIHPIEKQSLPEFFTNRIPSKTPQVYVKCRNFMVNSYRINPNEYFSVTTARRNVCGDAAAVFRIHKFLMKWGLINYQVDAQLLPKSVEPPFTGEYSTRHDAPRGLFPFESYKPSVQLPDMAKLKKMMDTDDNSSALNKYLRDEKRKSQTSTSNETLDVKHEDSITNGHESVENPHGAKRPKIIKSTTKVDDNWQRDELEKLLKGIQTHGSDWYKTARDVGNKTPEQCILKFLQMPIEDRFLHPTDENGSDLGPLKYAPHLPFSKSENPVMSTLAFLVGLVDPRVVQGMTDRALRQLEPQEEDKEQSLSPSQPEQGPQLQDTESPPSPPPPTVKEASGLAISSLGIRSHVFANNEERQMSSIAHQMAHIQLQKVDIKLKLLDKVEKSLELEKKTLQRQQEDVLVQRISLAKHSKNISKKLEESLDYFEDKERLAAHIDGIKNLISNPPKLSIGSAFANSGITTESDYSTNKAEGEVKPVSVEAPQSYRYWSA